MNIVISNLSSEAIYMQIVNQIKENILNKISKGISFDKEKFNLDKVKLDYNATFYKCRSKNSLIMGFRGTGGEEMIEIEL